MRGFRSLNSCFLSLFAAAAASFCKQRGDMCEGEEKTTGMEYGKKYEKPISAPGHAQHTALSHKNVLCASQKKRL